MPSNIAFLKSDILAGSGSLLSNSAIYSLIVGVKELITDSNCPDLVLITSKVLFNLSISVVYGLFADSDNPATP